MTTKTTKRVRLVKITLLAAFDAAEDELLPGMNDASLETLADDAAENLRNMGALTVASEYDTAEADIDEDDDNDGGDNMLDALVQQFPSDGLPVGPVPGVRVLGRNGTFKKARLERKDARIELWLGTEKEQYPLVSFPVTDQRKDNN